MKYIQAICIEEHYILVDIADADLFNKFRWTVGSNGYVICKTTNPNLMLHRVIMNYSGPLVIDHVNGNPLDNRKKNLRIVDYTVNRHNTKKLMSNNTNGFTGVEYCDGSWRARIKYKGKRLTLGRFDTPEEADAIRKQFIKDNIGL